MASVMAQFEMAALLSLPPNPTMEESFQSFPRLQAGLDQAMDMLALVYEYPELAAHINPGGLPNEPES